MKLNNLIKTVAFAACYNSLSLGKNEKTTFSDCAISSTSEKDVLKHICHIILASSIIAAIVNFAKPKLIKNYYSTKYKLHILVALLSISLIYLVYLNFNKTWIKNKSAEKETLAAKAAYAEEKAAREAVFNMLKAIKIAREKEFDTKCTEEDAKSLLDSVCAIKLVIKEAVLAAKAAIKTTEDSTCPSEAARAAEEAAYIDYEIERSTIAVEEILNTAAQTAYQAAYKASRNYDMAEKKRNSIYEAYRAA